MGSNSLYCKIGCTIFNADIRQYQTKNLVQLMFECSLKKYAVNLAKTINEMTGKLTLHLTIPNPTSVYHQSIKILNPSHFTCRLKFTAKSSIIYICETIKIYMAHITQFFFLYLRSNIFPVFRSLFIIA